MPHNIPINQHQFVIGDNPCVIHMFHTPMFHFVVGRGVYTGSKKIQYEMLFVVHTCLKSLNFFTSWTDGL